MKKVLKWGLIGLLGLSILVAVFRGGGEQEPSGSVAEEQAAETDPLADLGCRPAPRALVTAIEEGLTAQGGKLSGASMVRSEDFKRMFYVSADIDAEGLEGPDDIATWATNWRRGGGGSIFAVDGVAREFSEWGTAMADDRRQEFRSAHGFEESQRCIEER